MSTNKVVYSSPCPQKSPPTVKYHADGSGRDTYVIINSGGLHGGEYKNPNNFGAQLRRYDKIEVRRVPTKQQTLLNRLAVSKESLLYDDHGEFIFGGGATNQQEDTNERSPSLDEYQRGWYYQRDLVQMRETSKMQKKLIKRLTEKNTVHNNKPPNLPKTKLRNLLRNNTVENNNLNKHPQSLEQLPQLPPPSTGSLLSNAAAVSHHSSLHQRALTRNLNQNLPTLHPYAPSFTYSSNNNLNRQLDRQLVGSSLDSEHHKQFSLTLKQHQSEHRTPSQHYSSSRNVGVNASHTPEPNVQNLTQTQKFFKKSASNNIFKQHPDGCGGRRIVNCWTENYNTSRPLLDGEHQSTAASNPVSRQQSNKHFASNYVYSQKSNAGPSHHQAMLSDFNVSQNGRSASNHSGKLTAQQLRSNSQLILEAVRRQIDTNKKRNNE
ncbi:hypothetical protein FGO68_gene12348 [Halteria grandinella]|uniref:Uncharacterized protein n=1 Tax=Halteria grandinella TaxID=5974 RepID=A0A8J8NQW2_HALGN|nr:hypothetical protein FGO68_gene12348 [Halteria grandinella]